MILIIACEVMKEELLAVRRERPVEFRFISLGLHRWPERLRLELRTLLADSSGYSAIVFAFGLCGGALAGLRSPGVPLVVARSHDCMPLIIDSRHEDKAVPAEEKRSSFLSGAWMGEGRSVFTEYREVRNKYGKERARQVLATMFNAYCRLSLIRTGHPHEETHLEYAQKLAVLLGLDHSGKTGITERLSRIVNGPWEAEDFITIEPFGDIRQDHFGVRAAGITGMGDE